MGIELYIIKSICNAITDKDNGKYKYNGIINFATFHVK